MGGLASWFGLCSALLGLAQPRPSPPLTGKACTPLFVCASARLLSPDSASNQRHSTPASSGVRQDGPSGPLLSGPWVSLGPVRPPPLPGFLFLACPGAHCPHTPFGQSHVTPKPRGLGPTPALLRPEHLLPQGGQGGAKGPMAGYSTRPSDPRAHSLEGLPQLGRHLDCTAEVNTAPCPQSSQPAGGQTAEETDSGDAE